VNYIILGHLAIRLVGRGSVVRFPVAARISFSPNYPARLVGTPTQSPIQWVLKLFLRRQSGRGVQLKMII